MSRPTQGERLTAVETELNSRWEYISEGMDDIRKAVKSVDKRLAEQEQRLAAYENKGKGILIGVGIFGTGFGATVLFAVERFLGVFK